MLLVIKQIFVLFFFLTILFLCVWLLVLLLKTSPNGEYSNLAFLSTLGLYPKSSSVRYSYLSNSLQDNAGILVASLSRSY